MIKNIFLPEALGSYFLFSRRILSFHVTSAHVRAVLVKASGFNRIVEKIVVRSVESGPVESSENSQEYREYLESISEIIKAIISEIGRLDVLYSVLTSDLVVYKDLVLPFGDLGKVKLVLPFEIENSLPFSVSEAFVDCIINDSQESFSSVFAVAAKREGVLEHLSIFEKSEYYPDGLRVDILELFSLYRFIVGDKKESVLLINIDQSFMFVGVIIKGQLIATRFLGSKGLRDFSVLVSQDFGQFFKEALREGQEEALVLASGFFADVKLVLEASCGKLSSDTGVEKILLTGAGADLEHLPDLVEKIFGVSTQVFGYKDLLKNEKISFKEKSKLSNSSIVNIASALSLGVTSDFNLNRDQVAEKSDSLILKQLWAGGALISFIFITFFANFFYSTRRFASEIEASSEEIVQVLKKEFPSIPGSLMGVDDVLKRSESVAREEKNVWSAVSSGKKLLYLSYLQELSTRLDAEGLGLNLTKLSLSSDKLKGEEIVLEGQVKDYESLKEFRENLEKSGLFKGVVPRVPELKFSIKLALEGD